MRIRLIDVDTRQLATASILRAAEEDARRLKKVIEYGILSHRWLDDTEEVDFEDIKSLEVAEKKQGFKKIAGCCKLAKRDGLKFIWIDTCCIDKKSSAELQESINSMYKWYAQAKACYAYLKDTKPGDDMRAEPVDEWFTRGWTLQELIAPGNVEFYDMNWNFLGTRSFLKDIICKITGIDAKLLERTSQIQEHLLSYSVAERMSWASGRETKEVEDQAYSLFGIFNVNMPMLYGEGNNAFLRLQEEIIKSSDDHSIFAWNGIQLKNPGMLALERDYFKDCRSVKSTRSQRGRSAYGITNRGLSITLTLRQWTLDTYVAPVHFLDGAKHGSDTVDPQAMTGIFLRRLEEDDQYARVKIDGQESLQNVQNINLSGVSQDSPYRNNCRERAIHIRQAELRDTELDMVFVEHHIHERVFGFRLCEDMAELFDLVQGRELVQRNTVERTLIVKHGSLTYGNIATIDIGKQNQKIRQIKLCFDFDFNPIIFLAKSSAVDAKTRIMSKTGYMTGANDEWQFTEEEKVGSKSLSQRSPDDTLAWSKVVRNVAYESHLRPGLWALQGHRLTGLDVVLNGIEVHVVLKRGITSTGAMIWDLQVDYPPKTGGLSERFLGRKN